MDLLPQLFSMLKMRLYSYCMDCQRAAFWRRTDDWGARLKDSRIPAQQRRLSALYSVTRRYQNGPAAGTGIVEMLNSGLVFGWRRMLLLSRRGSGFASRRHRAIS